VVALPATAEPIQPGAIRVIREGSRRVRRQKQFENWWRASPCSEEAGEPPRVEVQGKLEALIGFEETATRAGANGGIGGSGDWS
jgi:hypothetical protein